MHQEYILDVIIFLMSAVMIVSLFKRFRASPVLGYLVAGVIVGPSLLGLTGNVEITKTLAEFGIIFLLFTIGLELPLQRLQVLKLYVFALGGAQVAITTFVFAGITYLFGMNIEQSILIGSGLALSSTAVVIQVLSERGELANRFGRVSFSILLFQDLAVVLLLVLVPLFISKEGSVFQALGYAAIKAVIALTCIIIVGRIVLRPIFRTVAHTNNPELFTATTLLVVLLTSLMTGAAGLSMELGAFLAGIILSETEYRHQVEADIQPFRGLLLGLFFMSIGMSIDLKILINSFDIVLSILVGMVVLKALILTLLCKFFHLKTGSSFRVGLLLATGGEFVFVLLAPALEANFIPRDIVNYIFVAVTLSMALTPFFAYVGKLFTQKLQEESSAEFYKTSDELMDLKGHVIVAGFGRAGQIVAKLLSEKMIPFVAIDNKMSAVREGREKALPVFYGDVRRLHALRALKIEKARIILITIDQPSVLLRSVLSLRKNFPHVAVCVRVEDSELAKKLIQAGANVVIPESLEQSLQLASSVLNQMGTPPDEVLSLLDNFRKTHKNFPHKVLPGVERKKETAESKS